MTDLNELASRVEALTGPCRETDCAVRIAVLGDVQFGNCWPFKPETPPMLSEYVTQFRDTLEADDAIPDTTAPRFTASLDAAMSLVPDHLGEKCSNEITSIYCGSGVWQHKAKVWHGLTGLHKAGSASSAALALTAAALRARAAMESNNDRD